MEASLQNRRCTRDFLKKINILFISYSLFHLSSPRLPLPDDVSVFFSRFVSAWLVHYSPIPSWAGKFNNNWISFFFHTLYLVPALHAEDDLFSVIYQRYSVGFILQDWFLAEFKVYLWISQKNHYHLLFSSSPFHPGSPGLRFSSPRYISYSGPVVSFQTGPLPSFPLLGWQAQNISHYCTLFSSYSPYHPSSLSVGWPILRDVLVTVS